MRLGRKQDFKTQGGRWGRREGRAQRKGRGREREGPGEGGRKRSGRMRRRARQRRRLRRRRGEGRRRRKKRGERGERKKESHHVSRSAPQIEDVEVGGGGGTVEQMRHRMPAEKALWADRVRGTADPMTIILQKVTKA